MKQNIKLHHTIIIIMESMCVDGSVSLAGH